MNEYEQEDSEENWKNWKAAQDEKVAGPQDPPKKKKESFFKKTQADLGEWWSSNSGFLKALLIILTFTVFLWLAAIWIWSGQMFWTAILFTVITIGFAIAWADDEGY